MSSIPRALLGGAALLLAGTALPLAAQSSPSAPPQRFAYVDTRSILNAAPGRPEAETELKRESDVWQAEINRMQDSMNTMIAEFQKASATMTPAVKERRTKEIQAKQGEFQKRNDDINAEADRRRTEVLQPILDQIKIALEDTRQAMGLDVIFDIGQNATLVAVNKNLDITDRVIARLRLMPTPTVKAASTTNPAAPGASKAAPAAPKPPPGPVSAPAGIGRPTAPARVDTNSTSRPGAPPAE